MAINENGKKSVWVFQYIEPPCASRDSTSVAQAKSEFDGLLVQFVTSPLALHPNNFVLHRRAGLVVANIVVHFGNTANGKAAEAECPRTQWFDSFSVGHGLQTLHGLCPALIASSRLLNVCRFEDDIRCAHLQPGRWNGSRMTEATSATPV